MTLYEKYLEQKEKYLPIFKEMTISYYKPKNRILYAQNGNALSVEYEEDMMTIKNVATKSEYGNWKNITNNLRNINSTKFYHELSYWMPFRNVYPLHMSSLETQGLFDVMLEIVNNYIKQNNYDTQIIISYTGYGCANTPTAKTVSKQDAKYLSSKECLYDENTIYTAKYIYNTLQKEDKRYLQFCLETRNHHNDDKYLDVIQKRIEQLEQTDLTLDEIERE